jgi:hypothetical protein
MAFLQLPCNNRSGSQAEYAESPLKAAVWLNRGLRITSSDVPPVCTDGMVES